MIVSVAALIIALCALLWNIISAVHSWNKAKPAVKVEGTWASSRRADGKSAEWLVIIVRNIGGAAISVVSIYVWWFRDEKTNRKDGFGVWEGREIDGNAIAGSILPYTLTPLHSGVWKFDLISHIGWVVKHHFDTFLIEVTLGTGQVVRHELSADGLRLDIVAEAYEHRRSRDE